MASITTRAGKGSPLTNAELDANFNNINAQLSTAVITGGTIDGATIGATTATTGKFSQLDVDNLRLDGNTIVSTDTNGNIDLTPNGTGEVNITKVDIDAGTIDNTAIGATTAGTGAFTTLSATGVTTVQAGTVSAPAITTTGDTNTGIFFPAADTIAFAEGGAEAMRIDSSGNVGIGTSSPSYPLDVQNAITTGVGTVIGAYNTASSGSSIATLRVRSAGTGASYWDINTGNTASGLNGSIRFFDNIASAERMRIDTSGNLGIGTSSPSYKLDVVGTGDLSNRVSTTGTSNAASIILQSGSGTTSGLFAYARFLNNDTNAQDWRIGTYGTNNLSIVNAKAGTVPVTVDTSGNVGVGTTSPQTRLNVFGSGSGGATQTTVTVSHIDGGSGSQSIRLGAYQDGASVSGGAYLRSLYNYSNSTSTSLAFLVDNGSSAIEAMRIDSSGNLLVGTTSGSGDKIYASGYIRASSGFKTDGTTWIDSPASETMRFVTNNTERARITSGGFFKASDAGTYIGSTGAYHELRSSNDNYLLYAVNTRNSGNGPFGISVEYSAQDPNGTTNEFLQCVGISTLRAEIRSNGGLANYSANDVNLSDRREKTNFAPAKSYLDTICAIPVQTFNYIDQSEDDPGLTLGVVAQDVQAVAPELVMESNWGTEDNPKMRLSIYQTDLQYALMKALQELKAEFDAYKATHS